MTRRELLKSIGIAPFAAAFAPMMKTEEVVVWTDISEGILNYTEYWVPTAEIVWSKVNSNTPIDCVILYKAV